MTEVTPPIPGPAPSDRDRVQMLERLAPMLLDGGSDAMIGLRALLEDIDARFPGELERMASALALRRLGLSTRVH